MTYCHPVWVGTWGWNKVQPTVETLSLWDPDNPNNGAPRPDDPYGGALLVGTIGRLGAESWITVPGKLPDNARSDALLADVEIELGYADGRIAKVPALARMLPDSNDRQLVIELPDDVASVTSLARSEGGQRIAIER